MDISACQNKPQNHSENKFKEWLRTDSAHKNHIKTYYAIKPESYYLIINKEIMFGKQRAESRFRSAPANTCYHVVQTK